MWEGWFPVAHVPPWRPLRRGIGKSSKTYSREYLLKQKVTDLIYTRHARLIHYNISRENREFTPIPTNVRLGKFDCASLRLLIILKALNKRNAYFFFLCYYKCRSYLLCKVRYLEFKNLHTSDSIMRDENAKRDKAGRVALRSNGPRKKYTIVKLCTKLNILSTFSRATR